MGTPEPLEYKTFEEDKGIVPPEPIRESREKRRARERNTKSLEDQLHIYVNKYFKFISDNRMDMNKQAAELKRLNNSWRNWVNNRSDHHDVKIAAPMFIMEVDRLLHVGTELLITESYKDKMVNNDGANTFEMLNSETIKKYL